MPDPIQAAAEAGQQTQTPAQVQPEVEKPKKETRDEAAGKAVNAARNFFAKINKLEDKAESKKEEKPRQDEKPAKADEPENKVESQPEKKADAPPEELKVSKRKPKNDKKELVEALAEANKPLVEAIQKQAKTEQKADEPEKPKLSKSDEKMAARLKKLEEINPSYAGATDKFLAFKEAERKYQQKWEEQNPDEEFDPSDSAHAKWYERNEPSIDEDDFEEAKEALIREQAEKAAEEKLRKELEPVKRKQAEESAVAKAAPKIEKTLQAIGRNAAAAIDPKYSDLKDLSKIGEEDPLAAEILTETANRWMPLAQGATLLYSGHPADQNNPLFQAVGELVSNLEQQLSSLEPEMQVRNGKQFATIAEFAKMSPKEQARHWYVDEDAVVEFVDKRMAFEAKQRYESEVSRLELLAKKRGYVPKSGQSSQSSQQQKADEMPIQQQSAAASVRVGGAGTPPPAPAADSASSLTISQRVAKKIGW